MNLSGPAMHYASFAPSRRTRRRVVSWAFSMTCFRGRCLAFFSFIFFTNSSTSFLDQNRRGKTFGSLRSPFIYCVPKKNKNPKKTKKNMEINPCLKLQHATFRSHIASRPIRFSAVVVRLELWRTSTPDRRRRQLYIVSQLFSFAADRKN